MAKTAPHDPLHVAQGNHAFRAGDRVDKTTGAIEFFHGEAFTSDQPLEEDDSLPFSHFVAGLGTFFDDPEKVHPGLTLECLTVRLPLECRVERRRGQKLLDLTVWAPMRTETSVGPVLHHLEVRIEIDASN